MVPKLVSRLTHGPAYPFITFAACYQDIISQNQYLGAKAMASMRLPPKGLDSLISIKDCVVETAGLFDKAAS